MFRIALVNLLLGCAAFVPDASVQGFPCQSVSRSGTGPSLPSHQTVPSGANATLVYRVSRPMILIAVGLVWWLVPGTTPK